MKMFENVKDAVTYFVKMQAEIMACISKLNSLYEASPEIKAARSEYEKLMNQYKAESKAYFGLADGETINTVQLADFVLKVVGK